MPCYQDQRQRPLVAGRPYSAVEKNINVRSSSCDAQEATCKRSSRMWQEHKSSAVALSPYVHSAANKILSYDSQALIADTEDFDSDVYSMSSTRDLVHYLVEYSTYSPAAVTDLVHEFDDSDSSDSDSSYTGVDADADYDYEAEAQYITIPHESPWWKAPSEASSASSSSGSILFDHNTLVGSDTDADTDVDMPSNHSLEEVLQKQQYLVGLFHDELRRIVPDGAYDDSWLAEVDAKLLVAPTAAFEEACMGSMTVSPTTSDYERKPLPDVPVDFGEDGDIEDDDTASLDGEWEYPCYAHRMNILKAHPNLDPRFIAHMIGQ